MAATPPPTATAGPPPPPPITAIDLTQFAELVNNARTDHEQALTTPLVATANDGMPDIAYKGSVMVWDKDHLAWWERSKRETFAALDRNRKVAIFVRNPVRGERRAIRFYGEARVVDGGPEREAVWERVIPLEQDMDKEKKGVGVIVRVDRVRAGVFDIQRRGA